MDPVRKVTPTTGFLKEKNKYIKILYRLICDRHTPLDSLKAIKLLHNTLKRHGDPQARHFWEGLGSRIPGMQEIIANSSRKRTLQEIVGKYSNTTCPHTPKKKFKKQQRNITSNVKRSLFHMEPKTTMEQPPTEKYNGFKARDKPPLCYLSNLFGGAEFHYMAKRFEHQGQTRIARLLRALAAIDFDIDTQRFHEYRSKLQGTSSDAYTKHNKVAAGILATLINGCWRSTMKKRLHAVNEIANELGIPGQPLTHQDFFIHNDNMLEKEKKQWMAEAHAIKFKNPFYKHILINTHEGWLYERKNGRRDVNSNWAGIDGWMKQSLINTKQLILNDKI